jgi:hypothetical protein
MSRRADLVRLLTDFRLRQHHPQARREGGDGVDGVLAAFTPERREGLAVDGDEFDWRQRADQAVKQRRNPAGSREANMSPRWSWLECRWRKAGTRRSKIELLLAGGGRCQ